MCPMISIVVPVYNAAAFLARTVESIQAQDYENFEIILVNDGSRDHSLEVCRQLAEGDARIRVIDQENGGLSAARNAGTRAARGEFVGYIDSDDLIYPDMFSNLMAGYEQGVREGHGNFFVQIGREEIDEEGNRLPDVVDRPERATFISEEEFQKRLLLYTGDVSFCTRLSPTRMMLDHPFEPGVLAEDFSLQMKLMDVCEGMYLLPQVGYRVVHRKGSLTRRSNPSQFSRVYISIVEHADYVEEKLVPGHPDLKTAAVRFGLFERLDYMLHVPIRDMNRQNQFYMSVVQYLRRNFFQMLKNPFLTVKNKVYLTLFTLCPRKTRQIHWFLRGKKIMSQSN